MKRLLLLFIAILSCACINTISAQKIGHVDTQDILTNFADYKNAQTALENESKKYEQQMQTLATEYQTKLQAYQENVQLADAAPEKWSVAIRADKESELMQLQERIQRFQETAQSALKSKQDELFAPIMDKIDNAIKKVGTAGGYVLVLEKNAVLFINTDLSTDLTDTVKKELGIN
ncbi:MAG: OmpH family outer membrane protein [Bacteroidales bacterium]|nr:OmpH family outer membrane protein [Bacteroidales bacterium]